MFCSNCGNETGENANFCEQCGQGMFLYFITHDLYRQKSEYLTIIRRRRGE